MVVLVCPILALLLPREFYFAQTVTKWLGKSFMDNRLDSPLLFLNVCAVFVSYLVFVGFVCTRCAVMVLCMP